MPAGIVSHRRDQGRPIRRPRHVAEDLGVRLCEQAGHMIGGAAKHHAVDMRKVKACLLQVLDTAIDADEFRRVLLLQTVDTVIFERRDVAIFFRRQTLQPSLAGMHPQGVGACGPYRVGQSIERHLGILLVDADAALHRHRNPNLLLHRDDACADEIRRAHQAGAKRSGLHAVGRAADIEVDLVVAERLADAGGRGKLGRVRAAQLKRNRVLRGVKAEEALAIAMNDRVCHHHFRVKQRVARQLPMQEPAMSIRPIHHWSDS